MVSGCQLLSNIILVLSKMKKFLTSLVSALAVILVLSILFVLPLYLAVNADEQLTVVETEHEISVSPGILTRRYSKVCAGGVTYLESANALTPMFDQDSKVVKCKILEKSEK